MNFFQYLLVKRDTQLRGQFGDASDHFRNVTRLKQSVARIDPLRRETSEKVLVQKSVQQTSARPRLIHPAFPSTSWFPTRSLQADEYATEHRPSLKRCRKYLGLSFFARASARR